MHCVDHRLQRARQQQRGTSQLGEHWQCGAHQLLCRHVQLGVRVRLQVRDGRAHGAIGVPHALG